MHRKGKTEMALVGLVGWRGMVGSVLMERMQAENDFALIEPLFFSTSDAGGTAPPMAIGRNAPARSIRRPAWTAVSIGISA